MAADRPGGDSPVCPICRAHTATWVASENGLQVVRCRGCSHQYVYPVPSPTFLEGLYQERYYQGADGAIGFADYGSLQSARWRMFGRHLDRIEGILRPGRVLDVGCATGDFLALARDRGWEALGVDPSAARRQMLALGLPLVGTSIHDAGVDVQSLDLVTFWDVLEHVPDPVFDLKQAGLLLRPGGFVAVTVPAADNLVARFSRRRWFGYKTAGEHLQFFTAASLRTAFREAGFQLRIQRAVPWTCTVAFVAEKLRYLGRFGHIASRLLSNPALARILVDMPQINQFALAAVAQPD